MKRCQQIVHEKRKSQPEPQERKRVMLGPWRTLLRFGLCILQGLEGKSVDSKRLRERRIQMSPST